MNDHPLFDSRPAQGAGSTRTLGLQPIEPLPDGVGDDLRELDALLQAHASRTSIPRGLADAVYDVTVGLLWKRQAPLALAARAGAPIHMTNWGRLSMAAAIGMAFVVAAIFMQVPMQAKSDAAIVGILPTEVEEILLEHAPGDGDIWYLLETRDATFEDLAGDVENLLHELEL